ncbi:unnamed protein product [Dovyalis caffra]|uniref:Uncharacterized protein n=1 Tax=Dovyalis caffra TaxID=77055 RepID=A0AAV1SKK9_9ROSI|nr:unnamed protein product [Dovyalis caffra]
MKEGVSRLQLGILPKISKATISANSFTSTLKIIEKPSEHGKTTMTEKQEQISDRGKGVVSPYDLNASDNPGDVIT